MAVAKNTTVVARAAVPVTKNATVVVRPADPNGIRPRGIQAASGKPTSGLAASERPNYSGRENSNYTAVAVGTIRALVCGTLFFYVRRLSTLDP